VDEMEVGEKVWIPGLVADGWRVKLYDDEEDEAPWVITNVFDAIPTHAEVIDFDEESRTIWAVRVVENA
jgi:hypothetical protein